MICEGAQPHEFLIVETGTPEDPQDSENLASENQRMPGEALDALLLQPIPASKPFTVRRRVIQQQGLACRTNITDVPNS